MHRRSAIVAICLGLQGCAQQPQEPPAPAQPPTPRSTQPGSFRPAQLAGKGYASIFGSMEDPATSFGAVASQNHVYTLGGYSGNPHEYSREYQANRFARLDLSSSKWEELPSPGAIQSATLSEYRGKIIRVGGMRIDNAENEQVHLTSVTDVGIFDPPLGTWAPATPLPEPRSSHAAVIVGDSLYVIGGWALDGAMSSGTWANSVFVADLSKPSLKWARLPAPFESRALGAAHTGKFIVAVGGMAGRRVQRDVRILDTTTGTWTSGPELPEPGFGVAVSNYKGAIVASAPSGKVYTLNASAESWDTHAELIFPRFFHSAVATNDRLLVLGGIPGNHAGDRLRHIEQVSNAPRRFTSWLLNNPTGAKNRQGLFSSGNSLLLFGGNKALGQHDFAPGNFLQNSHELDLGSFSWRQRSPFPIPAQSMQTLVTKNNAGLSVGGFGPDGNNLTARPDVFRYDFEKDEWSPLPSLPNARTQFGLTEYQEKAWLFGGMNFDDTKQGDAMFSYPTAVLQRAEGSETPFVDSSLNIPRPRRAFASARVDHRFYLFGGMAGGFAPVPECEVFDFTTSAWSAVTCPSRVRIGAELVPALGKLYLIAGRSRRDEASELVNDSRVEVYDPASDRWSLLPEALPIDDTHQLRALPFGNRVLIYTAQRSDDQLQLVLLDPQAP